jgi:hypothetical protein
MIVYPVDKEIEVVISGARFWFKPLTIGQRAELLQFKKTVSGEDVVDTEKMTVRTLQLALKRLSGVKLSDGSDFELESNSEGSLTESCAQTLLNASTSLLFFTVRLANGTIDTSIEGVEINPGKPCGVKKKTPKR